MGMYMKENGRQIAELEKVPFMLKKIIGTFITSQGSKYIGNWKYDKKNGNGLETYQNGEKYDGEWRNDNKDGKGAFEFADGSKYVGEWKLNKRHGKGRIVNNLKV